MDFIDDGTCDIDYEHNNKTIIDSILNNMSLVASKLNYGNIDSED